MRFPLLPFLAAGSLWGTLALASDPASWPRFRGENGSGVAQGLTFPAQWTDSDFRWRVDLPGEGNGSPVVWGDRIFLLTGSASAPRKGKGKGKGKKVAETTTDSAVAEAVPQEWRPMCLSTRDGSVIWEATLGGGTFQGHKFNSPASSTPAVDAKRVIFTWGTAEQLTMVAFSHAGEKLWETALGPVAGGHGYGGSPVLWKDLVVLNNDQEDQKGNLLAVDALTGHVKWTVPRHSQRISYSVPCVFKRGGKDLMMFTNWQHGFTVIDPVDGRVVAEKSLFDTKTNERAISSPVVAGDLIIGTCGFAANPKQCVAVRYEEGTGIVQAWRIDRNVPHIPSVLALGERVFLWDDSGIVTCVKRADGAEVWKARLPGIEGKCFGSPVSDGTKIFCADETGNVHVIAVADELQTLGMNRLGDLCRSTPAVGDGAMFVRTAGKLVAINAAGH